ncbi:MAG: hypothetical protein ACREMT_01455, partial [Vulcanimicrobiaceae bacterium]
MLLLETEGVCKRSHRIAQREYSVDYRRPSLLVDFRQPLDQTVIRMGGVVSKRHPVAFDETMRHERAEAEAYGSHGASQVRADIVYRPTAIAGRTQQQQD